MSRASRGGRGRRWWRNGDFRGRSNGGRGRCSFCGWRCGCRRGSWRRRGFSLHGCRRRRGLGSFNLRNSNLWRFNLRSWGLRRLGLGDFDFGRSDLRRFSLGRFDLLNVDLRGLGLGHAHGLGQGTHARRRTQFDGGAALAGRDQHRGNTRGRPENNGFITGGGRAIGDQQGGRAPERIQHAQIDRNLVLAARIKRAHAGPHGLAQGIAIGPGPRCPAPE